MYLKGSKKRYINNKGVALLSILIAIAFVSIIGAALLYITYSNFQMKVANLRSKTNYYSTDGKLVEITSAIRNMNTTALADSTLYIKSVDPETGNITYVANLDPIFAAAGSTDGEGGTYSYSYGSVSRDPADGSESTLTKYRLNGLTVTRTDEDGYTNTVQTDLEYNIMKVTSSGGVGRKGVGEFSFLYDSTVTLNSKDFAFLTMYGDAYFSSYYYENDSAPQFDDFPGTGTPSASKLYTMPGDKTKPALNIYGETKINMMGEYFVVYGDLVLDEKASLYINNGNLTVYGDIYLDGQSAMFVNGNIYQPSSILPGRTKQCGIYCGDPFAAPSSPAETKTEYIYGIKEKVMADISSKGNIVSIVEQQPGSWSDWNNGEGNQYRTTWIVTYEVASGGPSGGGFDGSLGQHLFVTRDGAKVNLGNVSEVHPGDSTQAVLAISDEAYTNFCKTLGLYDEDMAAGSKDNDGIINQIVEPIDFKDVNGTVRSDFNILTSDVQNDTKQSGGEFDYYDRTGARVNFYTDDVSNEGAKGSLVFVTSQQGTVNLNKSNSGSTFVSAIPLTLEIQGGAYMTKTSNGVFNYLTQTRSKDTDSPFYNDIHHFPVKVYAQWGEDEYSAGDFIKTDANTTVQKMLGYSIGNTGGLTRWYNSVSFGNYVKDPN